MLWTLTQFSWGRSRKNVLMAVTYFSFVQNLYNFLSASTGRWALLKSKLLPLGLPLVKTLSDTRWSARSDAMKALHGGYCTIKNVLKTLIDDEKQKQEYRCEAQGLLRKMEQREYAVLTEVWSRVMGQFNHTNKSLQAVGLDLNNAVNILRSLEAYVATLRDEFDVIEEAGLKLLTEADTVYKDDINRRPKRSVRITRFEGQTEDATDSMAPREKFRTGVYLTIIDCLTAALRKRLNAYTAICGLFGFLGNVSSMTTDELQEACRNLVETYSGK